MAHHGLLKWLRQTSGCRRRGRGDNLIATARKVDDLENLSAAHPENVKTAAVDVTTPDSVAAAVQLAETDFGGLDVLFNNAGSGFMGAVEEAVPEEYRPVFETNVFGLIKTIRAALPALRNRQGARVVNFSSGAGIAGAAGYGYYNATKFAVEGFGAGAEAAGPLRHHRKTRALPYGVPGSDDQDRQAGDRGLCRDFRQATSLPGQQQRPTSRRSGEGCRRGPQGGGRAGLFTPSAAAQSPMDIADKKLRSFRVTIDAWRDVAIATNFD